jgi:hypothetical protein
MKKKANSPVVQVVQLESPLERLSDCRTVPYLRFFPVRNEEVVGSNPISSTKSQKCLRLELSGEPSDGIVPSLPEGLKLSHSNGVNVSPSTFSNTVL